MSNYQAKILLLLTVGSFVMLALSLYMAWSLWRVVRRLVINIADHMDGLMRKQGEVLQEVATVATVRVKRTEQPPENGPSGSSDS